MQIQHLRCAKWMLPTARYWRAHAQLLRDSARAPSLNAAKRKAPGA